MVLNTAKKYLGLVWMLLAPALICFMVWQAEHRISAASLVTRANTALQWIIILLVFLPICVGLFLFGRYAWQGEYAHLPESSEEITDYEDDPV
jgi:hypothetical protein